VRIDPAALDQLLHPTIDPAAARDIIATGLPASPGAACGEIVFDLRRGRRSPRRGRKVILVRVETSPEDIHGMHAAEGILTTRGGMTSPRGRGRPRHGQALRLGRRRLQRIDYARARSPSWPKTLKSGDVITIDGGTGQVLVGEVAMLQPELSGEFGRSWNGPMRTRRMEVRTNAETPADARAARLSAPRASACAAPSTCSSRANASLAVREMILAETEAGRRKALAKLLPMQRGDFTELFEIMAGLPVTIRLLDPPLHEFLPTARKRSPRWPRYHGRVRGAAARARRWI
jgi:pyruvate,orthophosphate dikinase